MNDSLIPFDVERVQTAAQDLLVGSDLRYFREVNSTNELARQLCSSGARNGTVLLTDFQRQGRGRRGRSWLAPPATSLLLSVIFVPPRHALPQDGAMLAALSVGEAIEKATGLRPALKWPNDVLLGGKKVCGILSEMEGREGDARWILGFGINGNFYPAEVDHLPAETTTLQQETGAGIDRETLALCLFRALDVWYRNLTRDPGNVYASWASRLDAVGCPVEISDTVGKWQGVVSGTQRDGALLVRDHQSTIHAVYAADVSIRQR